MYVHVHYHDHVKSTEMQPEVKAREHNFWLNTIAHFFCIGRKNLLKKITVTN